MGKTSKWLRSLLSSKKPPPPPHSSAAPPSEEKKKSKWALRKFTNEDPLASPYIEGLDANKHAIAVAAATAAVAEAALAAAQAAAEVVRLTSGGGCGVNIPAYISSDRRRQAAVIKIQSAFRAYLARRALRALKGLVKLQALVRGRIVRKQSADMLRRMQVMARIQERASARRSYVSDYSSSKTNIRFSHSRPPGVVNARSCYQRSDNGCISKDYNSRSRTTTGANKESTHRSSNWLNHWMEQYSWNNRQPDETIRGEDERSDKILEIDTWKPRQTTRPNDKLLPGRNDTIGHEYHSKIGSFSRLSARIQKPNPSISSEEGSSVISPKEVWTAESSPRVHSAASSRPTSNLRGPFTPTRSDCSRSLFGDYIVYPKYMANTESSRAKVRSQSAPKQRMRMDEHGVRVSSTFGHNLWESDAMSEKGFAPPTNHSYQHSGYVVSQRTLTRRSPNGISSSYGYSLQ